MNPKTEIILINISGEDKPGVTTALTEVLARYDAFILDIGQADIHHTLSLGILFKTDETKSGEILKDLLFKAYELGINIRFNPISEKEYESWVSLQGKNRYIITILGRCITARQISEVTRIVASQGLNIDAIQRLTGRIPLDENIRPPKSCIELSVRGTPKDRNTMQSDFMKLSSELEMDISLQEDSMYRRCRRLICFDMDSTLIETEVIDELAMKAGVGEKVKAITESAMRGEIDFSESFRRRVSLLKGLDVSVMREIAENLPITEGVDRLMQVLKRAGYKIANFNTILKIKGRETGVSNDLTVTGDISFRNTSTLIRRIDQNYTQATAGTSSYVIKFTANYVLSKRITLGAYYDRQVNKPLVSSTSYPITNSNYGISVRLSLTR